MPDLLLHPATAQKVADQLDTPGHAVIVIGPAGSGKTTLARDMARQLLGLATLHNYPYYLELVFPDRLVGIDDVRAIRDFVKRKTTGGSAIRRVCLIDAADAMTTEAANALLKMLEEPANDTVFVLTASTLAGIPETILSRTQRIDVHGVSEAAATAYFKDSTTPDIKRAYLMSGGRAALMSLLLGGDDHALIQAIDQAKALLVDDVYARLAKVDELSKDKGASEVLLFGFERIASSMVEQAALAGSRPKLKRAHRTLVAVVQAQTAHRANANAKLVLTNLFLNM